MKYDVGRVAHTSKWLYVCPKCGADYESDLEITTECGTCHVTMVKEPMP